jgi:hypothetical protein
MSTNRCVWLTPLFILLATALACSRFPILVVETPATATLSAPSEQTVIAEPNDQPESQSPTAEPLEQPASEIGQPSCDRANFSYNGVCLTIDSAVAQSGNGETVAAMPPQPDGAWWDVNPEYRRITLNGYVLNDTFHTPAINIYPIKDYAAMAEGAATALKDLNALLQNQPASPGETLPFLPTWNAGQVFHCCTAYIKFQNGTGVRYLTEYAQYAAPANNHDLFYSFQGLTADGNWYISAILPISNTILPASYDSLDAADMEKITQDYESYREAIVKTLEDQPAETFKPLLSQLDGMIASLLVQ